MKRLKTCHGWDCPKSQERGYSRCAECSEAFSRKTGWLLRMVAPSKDGRIWKTVGDPRDRHRVRFDHVRA